MGDSARLWALFPLLCVAVVLGHWTLLRLPYFWDEGGYYVPAALDFFRTGTLIPQSTVTNAHPPLPAILLAGWWTLFGVHILATRLLVSIVAASALLAVFRLAGRLLGTSAAIAVTMLTAVYPIWFAQSTLAHADIFAAALQPLGPCPVSCCFLELQVQLHRPAAPPLASSPCGAALRPRRTGKRDRHRDAAGARLMGGNSPAPRTAA